MIPPAERFIFTKSVYLYFKSTCYHVHFQDITLSKEQLSFKKKKIIIKRTTNFPERGLLPTVNGGRVLKKYSNYSHKIKFKPNTREVKHIQMKEKKSIDSYKTFFTENEFFFPWVPRFSR